VLDVGQGDAVLLRSPGGEAALVDAGPPGSPAEAARALARLGVGPLAFVAITHPAVDHDGGLADVLAHPGAASVLIPDPASPPWDAVRSVAARAGVPVADLGRGDRLRVGEWRVEVVHPPLGAAARVADPNEASLVASASARGTTVLLTGDAESPQLAAATGPVDVLKVGHHGSADEGLPRLLARLRPRSALVSAGKGNRHGHPHPATLAALAAAGIAVLRTDRDGDLVVTPGARPGLG
jgi:competence protein ComEC